MIHDVLREKAMELGADDARWAALRGGAVLLIFCAYGLPPLPAPPGEVHLSNYYPASQRGYKIAREVERHCAALGVGAREHKEHDVKRIAASVLGGVGKNTLFYHPRFGSLCSVHALDVETGAETQPRQPQDFCGDCERCARACPTGAIAPDGFHKELCVRQYMIQSEIPPEFAAHIYQLAGCERCQAACPKNAGRQEEPHTYGIVDTVEGKHLKELKERIGPNFGKRRMMVSQAIACAANTGCREAAPAIRALAEDQGCGQAARWALEKLDG